MPGSKFFPIQRRVRQRDVLNPFLFNAVFERAMRKLNFRLTHEGWRLGQDIKLTNLRHADDHMNFFSAHATPREEFVFMVETLAQKFSLIGLQSNGMKRKVLTTSTLQEVSHVEICGTMVAILDGESTDTQISGPQIRGRFD